MSSATAVHHADDAVYDLVPETAPPALARPRVLLVGTAFAAAAIITLFAGLIGIYLSVRHGVITEGDVRAFLVEQPPAGTGTGG